MSYRVFARKYRPQIFEEVVGQEAVVQTLKNAILQERLAQAYLFVGPRGVGKTSIARILAKALNCEQGPTVLPCNQCDICKEIAEGTSLDVLEIDGASTNSVEHVRDLREHAAYQPAQGRYKIYLIDEVHMLSTAAFNALLKTLEEPPPHIKFIFATTESQKLPATITSRCQRFDLTKISKKLIVSHLQNIAEKEHLTLETEAAEALAQGAEGGLRDAESMLDQLVAFCGDTLSIHQVQDLFGLTSTQTIQTLCEALLNQEVQQVLTLLAEQEAQGKDLVRLLNEVIVFLRDFLVNQMSLSKHKQTSPSVSIPLWPTDKIFILLEHFSEVENRLRWAPNRRLCLDVAMIKAIYLLNEVSFADVMDTLAAFQDTQSVGSEAHLKNSESSQAPTQVHSQDSAVLLSMPEEVSIPPSQSPMPSLPLQQLPKKLRASEQPIIPVERRSEISSSTPIPSREDAASCKDSVLKPLPTISLETATTSTSSDPESEHQYLSALWTELAQHLGSESIIRFGWLERGVFLKCEGQHFYVQFPASLEENTKAFFWTDLRKKVEALLTERIGKTVILLCDFLAPRVGTEVWEEALSLRHPEVSRAIKKEPEMAGTNVPSQTMASSRGEKNSEEKVEMQPEDLQALFKNDPLIQKALEIFKGTLKV